MGLSLNVIMNLRSTFAFNFNLRCYVTGVAVVGNKAYFGPYKQDNVGVFDTDTNAFSTLSVSGHTSGGSGGASLWFAGRGLHSSTSQLNLSRF